MRKIGEITDHMKKILLLLPIILLFLTGCADQTDFDEELFEISQLDFEACIAFYDTLDITKIDTAGVDSLITFDSLTVINNIYSVGLTRWIVSFNSVHTEIDTINTPIATVIVDGDTTYTFVYSDTINVNSDFTVTLPSGMDSTLNYDTTFTVVDTFEAKTAVGIYNNAFTLHRDYPLRYIIFGFQNGKLDTVGSKDAKFKFNYQEIFNYVKSENVTFPVSDTLINVIPLASHTETYMLFNKKTAGAINFYFNDYVLMELMIGNATSVDTLEQDDLMPVETVSDCTHEVDDKTEAVIKSRFAFEMGSGDHLFKLSTSDNTENTTVHATAKNNNEG